VRPSFVPEPRERGAALLTVLLLVVVMGALAAAGLEKLRLSTAAAVNLTALDQARAFAGGLESLVNLKIDDLAAQSGGRTTLAGGWNGAPRQVPLPGGGLAETVVRDGGNCFNINSLVVGDDQETGRLASRPAGIAQFVSLMRILEVPEGEARRIAVAAADWVDTDQDAGREGAEDTAYRDGAEGYRTGATLFGEPSELRAVAGMTPEIYATLRPWLCALPVAELSPINVNTLLAEQAPLLSMLAPDQIRLDIARQVLATRPEKGWDNLADFWQLPPLAQVLVPLDVQNQPQLKTRWFSVDLTVELAGAELVQTSLVDADEPPSRIVMRRWGRDR
jgi:general secretion pathway protein K